MGRVSMVFTTQVNEVKRKIELSLTQHGRKF